MKIKSLHFAEVGPLRQVDIDLTDDWTGETERNVLFSGPNGCGKSTVLRAVAMLWEAAGYWLDHRNCLPSDHVLRQKLETWLGFAVVFEANDLPHIGSTLLGLYFGDKTWCENLRAGKPDIAWMGEHYRTDPKGVVTEISLICSDLMKIDSWSAARKKMTLSFDSNGLANIIFLDAEERRWVAPKHGIGENVPDSPAVRWSPRYRANDNWQDQLESMLINIKVTQPRRFTAILRDLNGFLQGKAIEPTIKRGENRLRVKITGQRDQYHTLDELSAGEHQVLIMLFMIARWAEKGCIVMIDEPDLYLHPSLVAGMLGRLMTMVKDLDGQLLITSHLPKVWERFENTGRRIELGANP